MSHKKCPKCLEYPETFTCFTCRQSYCGCDQGSYYMLIGPAAYNCRSCVGGITKIHFEGSGSFANFMGGMLFLGYVACVVTAFSNISFCTAIICSGGVGIILVRYFMVNLSKWQENDEKAYTKAQHRFHETIKRNPDETKAQHRHRLNHIKWNQEISRSGLD